MKRNRFSDEMGLRLSRKALRVLRERGIFAQSSVSLQHQQVANRYVVRGVESGVAAGDIGRYVTFAQEDGRLIEYLQPVEAIGVNGLHSVVVATVLVRLDVLRKGSTYELLITRHATGKAEKRKRPPLETKVLFRGVHGRLELDLSGSDKPKPHEETPVLKMSAARIRSMFRRHNSVEEQVFRLSRNTRQVALGVPVTLSAICPAPAILPPKKTTFKRSTDPHAEDSPDRLSRPRP